MSIKIQQLVWFQSKQKGTALLALLALADRCNDRGICWPGVSDVAQKARVSKRQAQRVLHKIEQDGELFIGNGGGRSKSNNYLVMVGLQDDEIREVLGKHFELSDDEIREVLRKKKGDISGVKGDTNDTLSRKKGDISGQKRVTSVTLKGDIAMSQKGDIAMSPEPSRTIIEPSDKPSSSSARARARGDDDDDFSLSQNPSLFSVTEAYLAWLGEEPTPAVEKRLVKLVKTYSTAAVVAAIDVAVDHGGKSVAYVAKVLENGESRKEQGDEKQQGREEYESAVARIKERMRVEMSGLRGDGAPSGSRVGEPNGVLTS